MCALPLALHGRLRMDTDHEGEYDVMAVAVMVAVMAVMMAVVASPTAIANYL